MKIRRVGGATVRRAMMVLALYGLSMQAAAAINWCSVSHDGATNCSFDSIELCRANVAGMGGFCIPQAPIGHRQPRAADLPTQSRESPSEQRQEQRERKLDRSLQLCRGC
jgi:hypothetical protein